MCVADGEVTIEDDLNTILKQVVMRATADDLGQPHIALAVPIGGKVRMKNLLQQI